MSDPVLTKYDLSDALSKTTQTIISTVQLAGTAPLREHLYDWDQWGDYYSRVQEDLRVDACLSETFQDMVQGLPVGLARDSFVQNLAVTLMERYERWMRQDVG